MTKSTANPQDALFGERILIASGIVTLGTRPGYLDKLLGEQDVRRRVYNGKNIDTNSPEYQTLCTQTYHKFKIFYGEEADTKLQDIEHSYQSVLAKSAQSDNVQWLKLFTDSLMLSDAFMRQITCLDNQPHKQSVNIAPTLDKTSLDAAAAFSAIPQTKSALVADKHYKTTVYCGPNIACKHFKDTLKSPKLKFIESNPSKPLIADTKTKRLILHGHGNELALQSLTHTSSMQADDFAAQYFPNAHIIHALGCKIGTNPKHNFKQNSLSSHDILLLHAGDKSVAGPLNDQAIIYLSSQPNQQFPTPESINIIAKKDQSNTAFAALHPIAFQQIEAAIQAQDSSNLTDRIFDLIAHHINNQKRLALKKLKTIPQENLQVIESELEKVGYRDHSQESDPNIKKQCVQKYLSEVIMTPYFLSDSRALDKLKSLSDHHLINPDYHIEGRNAITIAAHLGLHHIVETLAQDGFDLNKTDYAGRIAAFLAARMGHAETLDVLAKYGADLNKVNNKGASPIIIAAQKGQLACVQSLHANHANIHHLDNEGASAIYMAAQGGHDDIVDFLAHQQVDVNAAPNNGVTPAVIAAEKGHVQTLQVLAAHNADMNQARHDGVTPLIMALAMYDKAKSASEQEKFKRTVQCLIENGANPDHITNFGSAFDLADDKTIIETMQKAHNTYRNNHPLRKPTDSKKEEAPTIVQNPISGPLLPVKERQL